MTSITILAGLMAREGKVPFKVKKIPKEGIGRIILELGQRGINFFKEGLG